MQGIITSVLISICAIICLGTIISCLKNISKQLTIMNTINKERYYVFPNMEELDAIEIAIFNLLWKDFERLHSIYGICIDLPEEFSKQEILEACAKLCEKGIIRKVQNRYTINMKYNH